MEIVSFARCGYEGELIKVEADLRRGLPAIDIVGLPDGAVREARERMRAAIRNSGLEFPRDRILINLSPADIRKEGSAFDLPIAMAVLLAAEGNGPGGNTDSARPAPGRLAVMVLGELELSGAVRPVHGVLSAVSRGLARGIRWFIVPKQNEGEVLIRRDARVIGVESLAEAAGRIRELALRAESGGFGVAEGIKSGTEEAYCIRWADGEGVPGFEEVRGQGRLVRALQIAAAGGHHLVAYGPPGSGKTLALRRFPALLPDLDAETAVTVTRIHSIAGLLESSGRGGDSPPLIRRPPFREPHQSTSLEGMTGGGKLCHPGEVSLAHGGVVYLDEAAQFRAAVLQSLRTPLETGSVTVSRAGRTDTYPARFQLLASLNPCPCGNLGSPGKMCTCLPEAVERYWKRLTAPLLDRIDLRIAVGVPPPESLTGEAEFSTAELREETGRARMAQWKRNGKKGRASGWLNADLGPAETVALCALDDSLARLFARSMETAGLSARGGHGVLKVARTIADLADEERIGEDHILEAVQYRRWTATVPDFL